MSRVPDHPSDDRGTAVISAMLVMLLMAALAAGFTALVITDTRVRALDGTRTQSFYAAHAGLEKLTADLGDLFAADFSPSAAQLNAIAATPPNIGAAWLEPDGTSGYRVTFPVDAAGDPLATVTTVQSGPFQGLVGLATPYRMQVTARLADRSEASLTRTLQTVAIPVFQFGIFSENDLSYFAGPDFNFGGRVHTNTTLFLAAGSQLTMADRVTAVDEIIRTHLSNGWQTANGYTGPVQLITAPAAYRPLDPTEGSLVDGPGSAQNEPTWTNLSTGVYNHNVMNGRTGARRLDLPVVSLGAEPIDLIRRPAPNEDVANPQVLEQRLFSLASLRVLLSDTAADISGLPGVTATPPVALVGATPWVVDAAHAPFALPPLGNVGAPDTLSLLGGFIKIEMQNAAGVWTDVTAEILDLGITGKQLTNPANGADPCGGVEPNPNAILRLQRGRDSDSTCRNGSLNARHYIPNALYDTREAFQRDAQPDTAPLQFAGIMHYVELDARNLSRWFQGNIGASGNNALNVNGYTVYFSDRRGNRNGAGQETAEFGFEDRVNPLSATGDPNGQLDLGEDFNGNNQLEGYGTLPILPAGMINPGPFTAGARPWTSVDPGNIYTEAEEIEIARRNPPIFFRRALKIVNGSLGNLVAPGLTIVAENPVYLQGNWNANAAGFGNPHVATAIFADAVTLLSNNWNDRRSFTDPHNPGPRPAVDSWYRVAIIAGKGLSFPWINGTYQDFGTDGGAHNFLRFLENWGGDVLNYRGSIASLFTSRQATGTYKCCTDVYSPPARGYNFDTEFLTPALLPPRTPMFRDVNITGFTQIIRPQ